MSDQIDIKTIAAAAHRAVLRFYGSPDLPLRQDVGRPGPGVAQNTVDVLLPEVLPDLAEMEERFVVPAVYSLTSSLRRGCAFGVLEEPQGCLASTLSAEGISIRAVRAVRRSPIFDDDFTKIIGYEDPVTVVRLDVLTVAP